MITSNTEVRAVTDLRRARRCLWKSFSMRRGKVYAHRKARRIRNAAVRALGLDYDELPIRACTDWDVY